MWPFFSSSYSSARINKVLVEIEMEQQPIPTPQLPLTLLQSLRDAQQSADNKYDDSDSEEEDRAIKLEPLNTVHRELNIELLEKLIDQPNLVQEIQQGKNTKLLSYISQDDVLNVLIDYLVDSVPLFQKLYYEEQDEVPSRDLEEQDDDEEEEEYDEELDDKLPYGKESPEEKYRRRASTAGEILAVQDPPVISQRLLLSNTDKTAIKSNEVAHFEMLSKLWNGILESTLEVDNLINVTLFVKIMENLIRLNCNEFMNFIRQNQANYPISTQFLNHADIPQLMELLIKLISMDRLDNPIGLIDILHDQRLIIRLLTLLDEDSLFMQNSIGDFLTNLISISANTPLLYEPDLENLTGQLDSSIIGPNDLTRSLVSDESVELIIGIILKGGHCLPTCVSLIIEIIRKNNSDYDSIDLMDEDFDKNPPSNRDPIFVGGMLKMFSGKLQKIFNRFFDKNYVIDEVETTLGLQEPVGFERFKTIELIAELLHCSNMMLLNQSNLELIISKRDIYKNQKLELMNDALLDNIIGDTQIIDDAYPIAPRERSNSQDLLLNGGLYNSFSSNGTGGLGGGDGSTSLVDLEKLTNDIKSFSIDGTPEVPSVAVEQDEEMPVGMSIGDFFKRQLVNGGMLMVVFSMLKKFPWNNFLHNVIFDISQQILNGRYDEMNLNRELILELFSVEKCYLTKFICDCYDYSADKESQESLRLGYMGHLILISEEMVKFSSKVYAAEDDTDYLFDSQQTADPAVVEEMKRINEEIHTVISEKEWLAFVNNELVTIRDMYNQVLGGINPDQSMVFLNPNTILLGNGDEEALEDFDGDIGDAMQNGVASFDDVQNNGEFTDDIQVIEGREQDDEFGESLHPVGRHNSDDQ